MNSLNHLQDYCLPVKANRRFSPNKVHRDYLLTATILISGLGDAAYLLGCPSFVLSLLSLHVGFTTALLVRL